ncbi:hypothetical protein LTR08_000875 [Meristemomyces frigidus]|nr:hypothetical protein LTR08_000875 [Meristemomyces frigidus]
MSLEQSFRRLALQATSVCHSCRRTLATSARRQQQQSATGALDTFLRSNRTTATSRVATPSPDRPINDALSGLDAPPAPAPHTPNRSTYALAENTIREASAARARAKTDAALRDVERTYSRKDLEGQIARRWRVGDVYSPHDLSGIEQGKWRKQRRKPRARHNDEDVMDKLGLNPLDLYRNFSIMGEYVTETGRIRGSVDTGLRPPNQRRMAKAIRRAIGIGLMPSVYRHPELLREDMERKERRYGGS